MSKPPTDSNPSSGRVTRRQILRAGAAALATQPLLCTRRVRATDHSQQLRVAVVGIGGEGWSDLNSIALAPSVKIVALCDVDSNNLDRAHATFATARTYRDYRKLLDEFHREVDAVIVATPDHMHGTIALAAMSLGKHVYVQKPLAHNLAELRKMRDVAEKQKVITQMGIQCHGQASYRTAVELLRQGAIGKAREAHSWVSRNLPLLATARPQRIDTVPPTLDWNLWQGVAVEKPYFDNLFHPFNWRQWRDYGCGMLGDMACHLFDPIFSGLDLQPPVAVQSKGPAHLSETFALDADVTLTFAATSLTAGNFTIRWTNGSISPDAARAQLPPGVALPGAGSFVVGELGVMMLPHAAVMPTFYRNGEPLELPVQSAGDVDHYHEWAAACRGEGVSSTPFSYAAKVTEAALVGVVAGDFPGQTLTWNSDGLKFDCDAATASVHRQYRPEWRPLNL